MDHQIMSETMIPRLSTILNPFRTVGLTKVGLF